MKEEGVSKTFEATCMSPVDSSTLDFLDHWKDLADWRKIKTVDEYCFDLFFLIKTMTNQLNTTKQTNPYPVYPTNPFTSKPLKMKDILEVRRRIVNNYLKVSAPLLMFLFSPERLWSDDANYTGSNEWRGLCISTFEKGEMRYVRELDRMSEDGELVINGFWDSKTRRVSSVENMVLSYLNTMSSQSVAWLKKQKSYVIPSNYYVSDMGYPNSNEINFLPF